ncbi:MAG: Sec-independent protein translocase protein TatB [Rheinheimera sp.]|nr:Sec-independent protein translocase protein TatB [Rheinheimera sp.]
MSFWELVVIGVVALVVLGPEKLPGAIRSVTGFIAGIKQFGHQMKAELSDELRAHELHQKLQEAEAKGLLGLTSEEMSALAKSCAKQPLMSTILTQPIPRQSRHRMSQ